MKNSVLIVENERATSFALTEGLAEDGYSIKAVASSEAALRFLKGKKCDLIITDIRLPGMSGVELLKKLSARRKIPSIVITASGSQEAHSAAKKAGAVKFFSKPFKVDEVKKSVAQALAPRNGGAPSAGGSGPAPRRASATGKRRSGVTPSGRSHRRQNGSSSGGAGARR
jgi:two-component system response regulator (stage 0 sporulation protein F)